MVKNKYKFAIFGGNSFDRKIIKSAINISGNTLIFQFPEISDFIHLENKEKVDIAIFNKNVKLLDIKTFILQNSDVKIIFFNNDLSYDDIPVDAFFPEIENIKASESLRIASRIDSFLTQKSGKHKEHQINKFNNNKFNPKIIFIGTSTGGPTTIHKLLQEIPEDFYTPIILVQHLGEGYSKEYTSFLNKITKMNVKIAENGEYIKKRTIYIAPNDYQIKLDINFKITLTTDNKEELFSPSVNYLFLSAKENKISDYVIGVILTGMGNDGEKGTKSLLNNGSYVITQSPNTAICPGMPSSSVKNSHFISSIPDIAKRLVNVVHNFNDFYYKE